MAGASSDPRVMISSGEPPERETGITASAVALSRASEGLRVRAEATGAAMTAASDMNKNDFLIGLSFGDFFSVGLFHYHFRDFRTLTADVNAGDKISRIDAQASEVEILNLGIDIGADAWDAAGVTDGDGNVR